MKKLVLLVCMFSFPGTLFGMNIDLQIKQKYLDNELLKAVEVNSVQKVKALLDKGADVNIEDYKNSDTALMYAAFEGHVDCVKILLDAGANINAQNGNGWTALMGAAMNGHFGCVNILLDAGADVNAHDLYYGNIALTILRVMVMLRLV